MMSMPKRSATRAFPASARQRARLSSPSSAFNPSANAAGLAGSTINASTPSVTISSGPPQRVTTTGNPVASASMVEMENPSDREGNTNKST